MAQDFGAGFYADSAVNFENMQSLPAGKISCESEKIGALDKIKQLLRAVKLLLISIVKLSIQL